MSGMILQPSSRAAAFIRALLIVAAVALLATPVMAKPKAKYKPAKIDKKTAKFETHELKKLIDRDAKALAFVQFEQAHTTDTEILAFCDEFEVRKQAEIVTLQTWLVDWYKVSYAPKPRKVTLSDDDEDTDTEFLGMMLGFHNSELAQAKQIPKKAGHVEFKTWANETIKLDRAQIAILKDMIQARVDPEEEVDD